MRLTERNVGDAPQRKIWSATPLCHPDSRRRREPHTTAVITLIGPRKPLARRWDPSPSTLAQDDTCLGLDLINAGVGALLEKPMDIPTLLRVMEKLLAETAGQRLARLAGLETEFHFKSAPAKWV